MFVFVYLRCKCSTVWLIFAKIITIILKNNRMAVVAYKICLFGCFFIILVSNLM